MKAIRSKPAEKGYILLVLMLAFTLILIAMAVEAPRIAQQIKREKEEELVHRGKDYATAIKRFVHKNGGRYPVSLDQLENTNHIRFLRKRYKDPTTGEDIWRLVHLGEAQVNIPTANPGLSGSGGNPGLSGSGNPGLGSGTGGSTGTSSSLSGSSSFGAPPQQPNTGGLQSGTTGLGQGNTQAGGQNQLGSLTTNDIGNGQPVGGGQIIGIASVNKAQAIKSFNEKDHYNDWFFVYDLRLEQAGGTGVTIAAPRAANAAGNPTGSGPGPQAPAAPTPVATPAPTPQPPN